MRDIPLPEIQASDLLALLDKKRTGGSKDNDGILIVEEPSEGSKSRELLCDQEKLREMALKQLHAVAELEKKGLMEENDNRMQGARLGHLIGYYLNALPEDRPENNFIATNKGKSFYRELKNAWNSHFSTKDDNFHKRWVGAVGELCVQKVLREICSQQGIDLKLEEIVSGKHFDQMLRRDVLNQVDVRALIAGKLVDIQAKMMGDPELRSGEFAKIGSGEAGLGDKSQWENPVYNYLSFYVYYNGMNTNLLNMYTGKPSKRMIQTLTADLMRKLELQTIPSTKN